MTFYQSGKDASEGWAFTEAVNGSYSVDRVTLETSENVSDVFRGNGLKGDLISAHPKLMPNGEHVNCLIPIPFGEIQVRSRSAMDDLVRCTSPLYIVEYRLPALAIKFVDS